MILWNRSSRGHRRAAAVVGVVRVIYLLKLWILRVWIEQYWDWNLMNEYHSLNNGGGIVFWLGIPFCTSVFNTVGKYSRYGQNTQNETNHVAISPFSEIPSLRAWIAYGMMISVLHTVRLRCTSKIRAELVNEIPRLCYLNKLLSSTRPATISKLTIYLSGHARSPVSYKVTDNVST